MTLAELMVTIGLLVIVGTIVMLVSILTVRTTGGLQDRLDDTTQAELGLASASKVLRSAVPPSQVRELENKVCTTCSSGAVATATGTQVRFYSGLGRNSVGPNEVTLTILADNDHPGTGKLVQQTRSASSTSGGYTYCTGTTSSCVRDAGARTRAAVAVAHRLHLLRLQRGGGERHLTDAHPEHRRGAEDPHRRLGSAHPTRTAVTRVRLPNVTVSINESGAS